MAQLMEYMYTGSTEARQEELHEFLTTATKLRIRGFGLNRSTDEENDFKKAFNDCIDEEKFPKFSASLPYFNYKKRSGRKSSVPKRLKLPLTKITNSTKNLTDNSFVDKKKFPILGSYFNNSDNQGTKKGFLEYCIKVYVSELKDDKPDITLTGRFVQILYTKIHLILNRAIIRDEREASLWSHQDRESQLDWEAHGKV